MEEAEEFHMGDDGRTTPIWRNQPSEDPWFIKERMDSNRDTTGPPRRTFEHPIQPTEGPRHHKQRILASPERPECIIVSIKDIIANPESAIYSIGDIITFTIDYDFEPTQPVTPIEWYKWNNTLGEFVLFGANDPQQYTVQDADIFAKNGLGLGLIRFRVDAYNRCSPLPSSRQETYQAQGTPP